ncbi:hypothetical protein ACIPM2_33490, partial [Streptomyces sp. NPDC086081]
MTRVNSSAPGIPSQYLINGCADHSPGRGRTNLPSGRRSQCSGQDGWRPSSDDGDAGAGGVLSNLSGRNSSGHANLCGTGKVALFKERT